MMRTYRCRKCKAVIGDLYDEQIKYPLPRCPKGHATELVPLTSAKEIYELVTLLNLEPSARESLEIETVNQDPLTFRQRMAKRKTHS